MTAEALRKVEDAYRVAFQRADAAREFRNKAVRDALNEGWTHAQIAQATGLTRSRVGQIAQSG